MRDDKFEWDDRKAARNARHHGVAFETARAVFRDPAAIDRPDDGHDEPEDRFATVAMVENRLLFVSYTMRGPRIRIISARLAEPHERRSYHTER